MKLAMIFLFSILATVKAETVNVGCGESNRIKNADGTETSAGVDALHKINLKLDGDYFRGKLDTQLIYGQKLNLIVNRYKKSKLYTIITKVEVDQVNLMSEGYDRVTLAYDSESFGFRLDCSIPSN